MAVILNVENLRKHYGPEPVLADVTFQVREGDKIGLVGPNGCGKTTLLNILIGREETERGVVERYSDATIGYLEQRPEVDSDETVLEAGRRALARLTDAQKEAEEIAMQMADSSLTPDNHDRLARRYDKLHEFLMRHDAYNIEHRVERILLGVGFCEEDMSKPCSALSGGEMNRLGLARLLLEEPDVMLLDEPSNHLDLAATEWLEDFLKNTSAAIILVSHDRYFLDAVTNRTLELYAGTVDDYPGNFSKYSTLKEERLAVQTKTYEKWVEEVEKTKDFIRKNHYGKDTAARAEDRRKKLERLEENPPELPRDVSAPPMTFPPASRTGDIVFRIEDLKKGYGDRVLFKEFTFDVQRGERWAILGPNGCGKTTFLRCLLGEETPDAGTVRFGQGVEVGYFDQQLKVVDDQVPVVDAIRPKNKVFEDLQRRKLLAMFGLSGDQQLLKVCNLSGGQRCRAALAKLAADDPNVLILDEPTNHLDLWARKALEKAIKEFDGSVIFISHDRYFVDQVADKILVVQPNASFKIVDGNYTTFRYMVSKGLIADPFLPNALDEPFVPEKTVQRAPVKANSDMSKRSSLERGAPKSVKRAQRQQQQPKAQGRPQVSASAAPMKGGAKGRNRGAVPELNDNPNANRTNGLPSYKSTPRRPKSEEETFKETQARNDKNKPKPKKRKRKFPYRKVSDIEDEIFMRETHLQTLNDDILAPETLRDGEKMKELQAEIKAEEDAIKALYEHWEEATELNW
ncbi:MAG: ABC-F family ATP-binding cassette domain-containing protein [Thermoguttaceae bacterium]|jgi:ATP-binding cassette subfamily F protein 3|nr:ABC-F family ATP-binding cassette domain-containing protein [Thermoguttaceae bacterium]